MRMGTPVHVDVPGSAAQDLALGPVAVWVRAKRRPALWRAVKWSVITLSGACLRHGADSNKPSSNGRVSLCAIQHNPQYQI